MVWCLLEAWISQSIRRGQREPLTLSTEDLSHFTQSGQQGFGLNTTNDSRVVISARIPIKVDGVVIGAVGASGGSVERRRCCACGGRRVSNAFRGRNPFSPGMVRQSLEDMHMIRVVYRHRQHAPNRNNEAVAKWGVVVTVTPNSGGRVWPHVC